MIYYHGLRLIIDHMDLRSCCVTKHGSDNPLFKHEFITPSKKSFDISVVRTLVGWSRPD